MQAKNVHEIVKPLSWIIGKWKSIKAVANYPTMESPVEYCENLSFISVGQPMLNYTSVTWNAKDKSLMPPETGYLCIDKDGSSVAFLVANGNKGLTAIQEGTVKENTITVDSASIEHIKFGKYKILAIRRCYKLNNNGQLEYSLMMQTPKTQLTEHLNVIYEKYEDGIE